MTLASRWEMTHIRQLAVEHLSACASSATKLELGKQYSISKWIRQGYLELCIRKDSIAEEEASQFDRRELVKIVRARERIRSEAKERTISEWKWVTTKYGYCKKFIEAESAETDSLSNSKYFQDRNERDGFPDFHVTDRLVHEILDEIFQLVDPAEGIDSAPPSRRGSFCGEEY